MSDIIIQQYNNKKASEVYENYIFIYQFQTLPMDTVFVTIDNVEVKTETKTSGFKKLLTKIVSCNQNILLPKKNCP